MITLYQFEISPFCDKIRRLLRYKGLDYQLEEINLTQTMLGHVKRLSPENKLPVLRDDAGEGALVPDSSAIVRYLEAKYPDKPIIPADPADRARAHVLEDWADEVLYFYEMRLRLVFPGNSKRWVGELCRHDGPLMRWLVTRSAPGQIHRQLHNQGTGRKPTSVFLEELGRHAASVDAMLEATSWLVGGAFSIADLAVYCQFWCMNQTPEGSAELAKFSRIKPWMAAVEELTGGPDSTG